MRGMEAAPDKLVHANREGLAWLARLLLELAQVMPPPAGRSVLLLATLPGSPAPARACPGPAPGW